MHGFCNNLSDIRQFNDLIIRSAFRRGSGFFCLLRRILHCGYGSEIVQRYFTAQTCPSHSGLRLCAGCERRAGAIGQAGGFAVFPDESTGMRAISSLLQSDSYINLTIAGAISRYAPPVENDTAAYHRSIQKLTGLSINRRISDLSEAELSRVANAIRQIEGWSVGRIVSM